MMGGAGLGGGSSNDTVYYVKAAADKGQYKILPVVMTVLIDQDRVQDFLVELENSPMSIQVMDFELERPTTRVVKPEKGTMTASMYGGGMGMGNDMNSMMMMRRMGNMSGYGGMAGNMRASMMGMGSRNPYGGMGGFGGMGGTAERKGTDVRADDRSKEREAENKAAEEAKGPSYFDPYFNIVEVTVYGQARFFNPPPVSAAAEPSPGETSPRAGIPGRIGSSQGCAGSKPARDARSA